MGTFRLIDQGTDLGGKFRSGTFVGIDCEDPISRREFEGGVALVGEVVEGADRDQVSPALVWVAGSSSLQPLGYGALGGRAL